MIKKAAKFVPPTLHPLEDRKYDGTSLNPNFIHTFMVIFSLVFFVGVILDIFVIFVMVRSGQLRKNISSFLLFHLSVTHLLFHVVVPAATMRGKTLQRSSDALCKVSAFVEHACPAAIFSTLVAIAWDRHKNILQPFNSLVAKTMKSYLLLVAVIWTYAVISSVSFVVSTTVRSDNICWIGNNRTKQRCEEFKSCRTPSDWKVQLSVTFYFLVAFVIPLSYMIFAYTRIAVRLWKRSKNGVIHRAVAKHKTKSVRLLLVAILGFVFCWSPSILINLLDKYGVLEGLPLNEKVKLKLWCHFIAPASSSLINTAVYAYFSPEFRKNCVKFGCCCRYSSCRPFIESCSQCVVEHRVGSDETSMKRFTRQSTAS